jgi:hypothetical protein
MSSFRKTIFDVEEQLLFTFFTVCLYYLFIYPACKGHPQNYIVICGLSGPTIFFSHFLTNGVILEKVIEYKMLVPNFPTKFGWKCSNSNNKSTRHYYKRAHVFMWRMRYFCHVVIKTCHFRKILENSWNTKFHENPSSGSQIVLCGQTGREAGAQ